jgi:hypothetical protein
MCCSERRTCYTNHYYVSGIGRPPGSLKQNGIEFGRHLILKKNQKPYVNSKSFAEDIKPTFIVHVTGIHAARGIE